MVDRLWESGVIKFLDEFGRPIIYGSDAGDDISETTTITGVDISKDKFKFHIEGPWYDFAMNFASEFPWVDINNHLSKHVSNGIYYIAGDGDDKVTATKYNDYLSGGNGDDLLNGVGGTDTIIGGLGNDTIYGGLDDDALYGGDGADILNGGKGSDIISGGAGNDTLYGGDLLEKYDGAADTLYGGIGFNNFFVDPHDTIVLSSGMDIFGSVYLTDSNGNETLLNEAYAEKTSESDNGKTVYRSSGGDEYIFEGNNLIINGGLKIVDFKTWAETTVDSDGNVTYSALGILLKEINKKEPEKDNGNSGNSGRIHLPDFIPPLIPKADPVIIDLNGNGIETLAGKGVFFDHGGDGGRERSGWVAATDGLLVRDLDGDGRITSGQELFGNSTGLKDGSIASNGFQALNDLDNNLDGLLDNNDSAWSSLQIWQDLNSNGVTDAGELHSLAQAGITAIDIRYATSSWTDSNGQEHRQNAEVQWSDGHKTISTDVWFDVDLDERDQGYDTSITEEVLRLPEARGFGNLPDLRQAMLRDTELQALVNRYLAEADAGKKAALLDQVIYQWAGAGDIPATVDFTVSRQQVAVLEKLTAQSITGLVRRDSGPVLLAEYEKFKSFTGAQLLAQTTFYEEMKNVVLSGYSSGPKDLTLSYRNTAELYSRLYQSGDYAHLQEVSQLLINLCVYSDTNRQRLAELHYYASLRYPGMAEYLSHDPEFSVTAETIRKKQNNFFWGGEGNQTIEATTGNNIIYGGKGNDALWGGKGDDTYIFICR